MYEILSGMRVVEAASFVAGPTCGLYLAQFGAEVIRLDMIGGGPDFRRWPRAPNGASLYWEGLNKGKKSLAIGLSRREGRELARQVITAPGPRSGLFVTNFPLDGFLSHEQLSASRQDLITIRVMGQANGAPALDYTVNCAVGIPQITGPVGHKEPVNHVLPAWDLLTGAYAAFALLAAERHRQMTGAGQEIRLPLTDLAISTVAHLGQVAEVLVTNENRARYGNEVYGGFGGDFVTSDGQRLMILAVTPRQWSGLVVAPDMGARVQTYEQAQGVNLVDDPGVRFQHREFLMPLIERAVAQRSCAALAEDFDRRGVCWGRYRTLSEAIEDPALLRANPIFSEIDNPSGLRYPAPGSAATLPDAIRQDARPAPKLGEHTDEILAELLGMSDRLIGHLHDAGLVAGAD